MAAKLCGSVRWAQSMVVVATAVLGFALAVHRDWTASQHPVSPPQHHHRDVFRFDVDPGRGKDAVSVSVLASYTVLSRSRRQAYDPRAALPCLVAGMRNQLKNETAFSAYPALAQGETHIASHLRGCLLETTGSAIGAVELHLIHVVHRGIFMPPPGGEPMARLVGI